MLTSLESFSDTIIAQFYQSDTFTNICVFVKTGLLYEEKKLECTVFLTKIIRKMI